MDAGGPFPVAKGFVEAFDKKYGYKPEWAANSAYMQVAMWADAVERAKTFYPVDVIKAYESGQHIQSTVGEVWFRAEDHQLVRPVIIVRGKKKSEMKGPDDYYDVLEVVPGEKLMQPVGAFGCHLGSVHLNPPRPGSSAPRRSYHCRRLMMLSGRLAAASHVPGAASEPPFSRKCRRRPHVRAWETLLRGNPTISAMKMEEE